MDDFGTLYSMYMSTPACAQWYVSMSTFGGYEKWDGWIAEII